jgi:hypothetical protein
MEHLFLMFLDHIQRRTTVGRTPLDEWSAHRRDLYLTTHDTHNRQISMPPVGFVPMISAGDISSLRVNDLTLILLTWRKWWTPNNARKWQMGFNSVFKGLIKEVLIELVTVTLHKTFGKGVFRSVHEVVRHTKNDIRYDTNIWKIIIPSKPLIK